MGANCFSTGSSLMKDSSRIRSFLKGWDYQKDEEGLIVATEDMQMLDSSGEPIPGLFAAGDIISGERNLIATAFALGQEAGLSASDSLRHWHFPRLGGEG